MCHRAGVDVRGQFMEVDFLLPLNGSRGLNSEHQASGQQVLLPTEPSLRPWIPQPPSFSLLRDLVLSSYQHTAVFCPLPFWSSWPEVGASGAPEA